MRNLAVQFFLAAGHLRRGETDPGDLGASEGAAGPEPARIYLDAVAAPDVCLDRKNDRDRKTAAFGNKCVCSAAVQLAGEATAVPAKECVFDIGGLRLNMTAPQTTETLELTAVEFAENSYGYGIQRLKKAKGLGAGSVALDLGANLGFFAISLAKLYPGVRVYAFEPNPTTARFLRENVARNGVARQVDVTESAITGDGRKLRFWRCSSSNIGRNGMYENKMGTRRDDKPCPHAAHIGVPSVTLAEIVKQKRIKRIQLMKIDCEGCEFELVPQLRALGIPIDRSVGECHHYNGVNFNFSISEGKEMENFCHNLTVPL